VLNRQVTLFREVQSFRLLALATVGSAFGTWLAFVALTIDVYDRTGSAVWVSALLIADFLPAIVIGVAASSLVDRLPRRRLMIASDLARVAIFAVLPFANGPGAIVALAALAGAVLVVLQLHQRRLGEVLAVLAERQLGLLGPALLELVEAGDQLADQRAVVRFVGLDLAQLPAPAAAKISVPRRSAAAPPTHL
jgi:MFS family permease